MATKLKRDRVMFTFIETETQEFQEKAVEITKNILLRKEYRTPFDLIQFCKWTDTLLPYYIHFKEVKGGCLNDLNKFITESNVYTQKPTESSWIKGLHTSIKYAIEDMKDNTDVYNSFQIILFTSLEMPATKENIIQKCINNLHEKTRIRCYILGPQIEIPLEFKLVNSIPKLLANDTSLIQQYGKNAEPLLEFVKKTNGLTCGLEIGQHLIAAYKPVFKNPLAWKTNLTIGDTIAIPIEGYRFTHDATLPKLNTSKEVFSGFENEEKQEIELPDQLNNSDEEDTGEVSLTRQEIAAHKMKTERCLDLLFVIDASDINETYNVGAHSMYLIFSQPSHQRIFSTFVNILQENNYVAIARKCYNRGNYPKLVALIPRPDLRKNCLQLMEMPYFENISDPVQFVDSKTSLWNITSILETKYPELKEPIFNYLDALCIEKNESLIDKKAYLPVHLVHNPEWDGYYQVYLKQKEDPKCKLEPQIKITNFFDHVPLLANAVEEARQQIFG